MPSIRSYNLPESGVVLVGRLVEALLLSNRVGGVDEAMKVSAMAIV